MNEEAPNRDTNPEQLPKESRRIALHRKMTLRFTNFEGFVTEYSSNLSMTGMFIRSDDPKEPGTNFDFEFKVADGLKLIQGSGEVVWARSSQESADRPPGMGIHFVDLDNESKRLIRWIVERHIYEGGTPFELDELKEVVEETLQDSGAILAEPEPIPTSPDLLTEYERQPAYVEPSYAQRARPAMGGHFAKWAAAIVAVLALLWFGVRGVPAILGYFSTDRETVAGARETPRQRSASVTLPQTSSGEVPESRSPLSQPATSLSDAPDWDQIKPTVQAWADAWQQQRAEEYLAFYAKEFRPGRGMSLNQWRATRRERLTAPEFIRVAVTSMDIRSVGENQARAVFQQSYRSDRLSDVVTKALDLIWEDGAWKIRRESVTG